MYGEWPTTSPTLVNKRSQSPDGLTPAEEATEAT
jgi:hypothetical protein